MAKMTRRTLFARLLSAIAAVPLVGKLAAKSAPGGVSVDPDSFTVNQYREMHEMTRAELEKHYPPAVREFNAAMDRKAKQAQKELYRMAFYPDDTALNAEIAEHQRKKERNRAYWMGE